MVEIMVLPPVPCVVLFPWAANAAPATTRKPGVARAKKKRVPGPEPARTTASGPSGLDPPGCFCDAGTPTEPHHTKERPMPRATHAACFLAAAAGLAHAQATDPHVFIANEGNLEGSVTSMRVEGDGTLTFVDRVVTGSRPSTSQPCPGCNPFAITITPNGRWLATTHASGNADENVIVYEVAPDGSVSVATTILLPQAGLDIAWVRDDLLAVCITNFGGQNEIRLYEWNPAIPLLSLRDANPAGGFLTSLAVHPNQQWLYANDSNNNQIRLFTMSGDQISLADTINIPLYGTALELSPDGKHLYASGGISAGGNAFAGYAVDPDDGTLTALPGSPFTSPGQSPKGFAFTPDGSYLYVSHGTDATIRAFRVDPESGVPTSLGFSFDVGLQGTLQGMDTLENRLFALDDSTAIDGVSGAYSFDVDPDTGAFTPAPGAPFVTQGISPNDVVAWPGAGCPADLAEPFGTLNFFDLSAYLDLYNAGDPAADLADPAGELNFFDLSAYLGLYNAGCP
jgi:6-phosphogluconolactonase (cycloisomerase 2 family)